MLKFTELVSNCQAIVREGHGRPLMVGMGGGECAGKTYLSAQWKKLVGDSGNIIIIPIDGYLMFSRAERANFDPKSTDLTVLAKYIGDHPSSFDHDHLVEDLQAISKNRSWIPRRYDYERGEVVIEESACEVPLETVVIVEGLFALCKTLQSVLDVKIFITTPVDVMRQRYIVRHEKREPKTFQKTINTFERMVLPTYHEFIVPCAENAEYIIHNVGPNPTVRKLRFGRLQNARPIATIPNPRLFKVFITHNLDKTTDFMMNTIRSVADRENIQIVYSSPGGAAASPSEDVRTKITESDALLAVIGKDTNWVSNEIGMAYAFDLPIYAIHHPENSISGVAKMTTSTKSADIFKPAELEQACENAFTLLKKEIKRRYAKLPEIPHRGGAISHVSWEKYYELVQAAFKTINSPDPTDGYAPTLLLGLSRGGIIAADIISRLGEDTPLGLLDAKRRVKGGEVLFEEEPLQALLEAHCRATKHQVRILLVDDVLKTGASLLSAMRVVERLTSMLDPGVVGDFMIRALVLIYQGEPHKDRYVPDYYIEKVEESVSVMLPYGRG